jgi:hypothetical protein
MDPFHSNYYVNIFFIIILTIDILHLSKFRHLTSLYPFSFPYFGYSGMMPKLGGLVLQAFITGSSLKNLINVLNFFSDCFVCAPSYGHDLLTIALEEGACLRLLYSTN